MATANRVYCSFCGAEAVGGRRYCSSCGRALAAHVSDSERSPGLIERFLTWAGLIIAIPVGLLLSLLSAALPILVVVALFMGPSDTWDMVQRWIPGSSSGESATCAGFKSWYNASADRSQEAARLGESYQSSSAPDPASLRSLAKEVDALATEQQRSIPPPEAVTLNEMMVETLQLPADALRAMANGDRASVQSFMREAERLTPLYDAEEKRVFDLCK